MLWGLIKSINETITGTETNPHVHMFFNILSWFKMFVLGHVSLSQFKVLFDDSLMEIL